MGEQFLFSVPTLRTQRALRLISVVAWSRVMKTSSKACRFLNCGGGAFAGIQVRVLDF